MSDKVYFNGRLNNNKFKQKDSQPDMIGDLELTMELCENIHKQYLLYKDRIHSNDDPKPKISIAGWFNMTKPRDGKDPEKYLTVRGCVHRDRKDVEEPVPNHQPTTSKPTSLDDLLS